MDSVDGCPGIADASQADSDGDGAGDACDAIPNDGPLVDQDGDTVSNASDNCLLAANLNQADFDGDGVGDASDNCLEIANADQADVTLVGVGDRCVEALAAGVAVIELLSSIASRLLSAPLTAVFFIENPEAIFASTSPNAVVQNLQGRPIAAVSVFSPADLTVTDPVGRRISKVTDEIPGAVYIEHDFLSVGTAQDFILFTDPDFVTGNYSIEVTGDSTARSDSLYSLLSYTGTASIVAASRSITAGEVHRFTAFLTPNSIYQPSRGDVDGDLITDLVDNCPLRVNADQVDIDVNGVGDPCEPIAGDVNSDRRVDDYDLQLVEELRQEVRSGRVPRHCGYEPRLSGRPQGSYYCLSELWQKRPIALDRSTASTQQ